MVKRVTPAVALDRLKKTYRRHAGSWALQALGLQPSDNSGIRIPLHPPTQKTALQDQGAAIDWVASWREHPTLTDFIQWETRQWSLLGNQQLPVRLELSDATEVAGVIGAMPHWSTLTERFTALHARLQDDSASFLTALTKNVDRIVALSTVDFQRLLGVLAWFAEHHDAQLYLRQLPIRGVDTKWIKTHESLVLQLHVAHTGYPDLGLKAEPKRWRIRLLDEDLWLHGLSDITAPTTQLAALDITPRHVLIVENLISLLTLPPMQQTVAIFGQGKAITGLAGIPWIHDATVHLWGDLDSHGFHILHLGRAAGIEMSSLLMDLPTLEAFQDLWVTEAQTFRGDLGLLTSEERRVVDYLREHTGTRLEQERIEWAYVLEVLRAQGLLTDRLD